MKTLSHTGKQLNRVFGAALRKYRIHAGLSMEQLGKAIEVSGQQVQKYEMGQSRISLPHFIFAANMLGIEPAHILRDLQPGDAGKVDRKKMKAAELLSSFNDLELDAFILFARAIKGGAHDTAVQSVYPTGWRRG